VSSGSPAALDGTAEEEALARAGAYALLAELFERAPRRELRTAAAASPLLAEGLAHYTQPDELEADHEEAFGFQVFPLAGTFLEATPGTAASALLDAYRALGFDAIREPCGIDHLATLLGALAHASGREARAERAGALRAAAAVREATRDLLDRHILAWLPAWASATRRLALPWPSALADQVLELVAFHRADLDLPAATSPALPGLPDLDDAATDLGAIADALSCAARAGVFLSRRDMLCAARRSRTPIGFGPRSSVLLTALREGAHLGTLPAFLDDLAGVYRAWREELAALGQGPMQPCRALLAPWDERSEAALNWLGQLERAARNEVE